MEWKDALWDLTPTAMSIMAESALSASCRMAQSDDCVLGLSTCTACLEELMAESIVMTFLPHTQSVFSNSKYIEEVRTIEQESEGDKIIPIPYSQ